MRAFLVFAAACLAGPAQAADLTAASRIDAVTVYPSGAEVTRLAKVKLERGDHAVLLTDLPPQAVPGSIRVEGRATGRLEVGSVNTRRVSVPRGDAANAESERKRLEDQIESLKDQRNALETMVRTAEVQKTFIANLAQLPTRPVPSPPAGVTAGREDWTQILGLIGTSMADVQRTILDTEIKIRALDRSIRDLERKLITLAPIKEDRTEVTVFVSAGAALEADLAIRYQIANAQWSPSYDARLTTGGKTAPPRLQLVRRAAITQRTGEPWENVALSLSTARPSAGSAAPELYAVTVDFEPERPPPPPRPVASAPAGQVRSMQREALAAQRPDQDGKVRDEQPALEAVGERDATAEVAAFQVQFAIAERVTVPNTGEAKRVRIDEAQLEPALIVRTVPKRDAKAYLYSKMALPKATPYLAGPVSLFRDQTFVGTGQLPQLPPGEEHELGFGSDDLVRVRYAVIEEKRGESGIISASTTDQRNYRVVVRNGHERPITLVVVDQVPVSNNQDIKVEPTGRAPTRRDLNDKRGVVAWEDKLNPDEERAIEFGYRVSWPAAKRVQYSGR